MKLKMKIRNLNLHKLSRNINKNLRVLNYRNNKLKIFEIKIKQI